MMANGVIEKGKDRFLPLKRRWCHSRAKARSEGSKWSVHCHCWAKKATSPSPSLSGPSSTRRPRAAAPSTAWKWPDGRRQRQQRRRQRRPRHCWLPRLPILHDVPSLMSKRYQIPDTAADVAFLVVVVVVAVAAAAAVVVVAVGAAADWLHGRRHCESIFCPLLIDERSGQQQKNSGLISFLRLLTSLQESGKSLEMPRRSVTATLKELHDGLKWNVRTQVIIGQDYQLFWDPEESRRNPEKKYRRDRKGNLRVFSKSLRDSRHNKCAIKSIVRSFQHISINQTSRLSS